MKQLPEEEIKKKLKAAFWDRSIDVDKLYQQLLDKSSDNYMIDKRQLFSRLLLSIDWYSLLKIIPSEKWNNLLDENNINLIFPKSLQKRFHYARRILLS